MTARRETQQRQQEGWLTWQAKEKRFRPVSYNNSPNAIKPQKTKPTPHATTPSQPKAPLAMAPKMMPPTSRHITTPVVAIAKPKSWVAYLGDCSIKSRETAESPTIKLAAPA